MRKEINTPFGFQCLNVAGKPVLISDEDVVFFKSESWSINKGYVRLTRKSRTRELARLLINCPPHLEADHINRCKLDNRQENLRACTRQQNCRNIGLQRRNTTGVTGVSFDSVRNKYMASIFIDGRQKNLGRFNTVEEASQVRRDVERQINWRG